MRKLARILSLASVLGSVLLLFPVRSARLAWLTLLKMPADARSLLTAALGAAGTLIGLVTGDRIAVAAGLSGAALSVRHIRRVSAPHGEFDRAFGPGWQARIPASLCTRMLVGRWMPVLPVPPAVSWQRDVVFGIHRETGRPLLCDLWLPPADVERTGLGVIYLHGGGWYSMNKDTGTRHFFAHLANQGHAIMDVAYTLAPEADLRGMLNDVRRAIAWLKTEGTEYGVSPDRVVLMGSSAGGHLALLAAYTAHHPDLQTPDVSVDTSVRAVVSYYGITDLLTWHADIVRMYGNSLTGRTRLERLYIRRTERNWKRDGLLPGGRWVAPGDMLRTALGVAPEDRPDLCRLYSPITHVGPHCPPTLLLHGAHDLGVLPEGAYRLHRALCEAGVISIYVELAETDHAFDFQQPQRINPAYQAALYDVERFLALMV